MKLFHKQAKRPGLRERRERGFMLLEVLVSVLLFALGIVALVGLQARSLGTVDNAQYRAEAIHFANAYIGKIWAAAGVAPGSVGVTDTELISHFAGNDGSGGPGYAKFSGQVMKGIPEAFPPKVEIVSTTITYPDRITDKSVNIPGVNVTITIGWGDPQDKKWGDTQDKQLSHAYTQTSSVAYNP